METEFSDSMRSAGGWSAVKTLRQTGFRQKADERILGDGDFVTTVLKQADEQLERKYYLEAIGSCFIIKCPLVQYKLP